MSSGQGFEARPGNSHEQPCDDVVAEIVLPRWQSGAVSWSGRLLYLGLSPE